MRINSKMFSLPPHVSTSWRDVQSLHMKDGSLIVSLLNGECVAIPNLSPQLLDLIFSAHASFLEEEAKLEAMEQQLSGPGSFTIENMGNLLQHNPQQANAPELPQEMLLKIAEAAKLIVPEDPEQLPKAEPHCNCMHCQIARVIGGTITNIPLESKEIADDPIDESDLRFQQWEVEPAGDKLFTVTSRLDPQESYRVFLGNPIGCTCGHNNCEHIVAALQS